METKYTSRDFYNAIINGTITEKEKEFATAAIEKLDAKNANRNSKPTKTQTENEPIITSILETLSSTDTPITAPTLAKGLNVTTQKISGICTQLVKSGKLVRHEVKVVGKGKMVAYTAADGTEGED